MNCWHCKHELIWECDYDIGEENECYSMLTILGCPDCGSTYEVSYPKEGYGWKENVDD
jgi:hypothetical protein